MTVLGSLFESRARKEGPYSLSDAGVTSFLGFDQNTGAGIFVDENVAMTCTTVYACVRINSESIASMPLYLYRRKDDGGRDRAIEHPVFDLLANAPNPEMSSMIWRETMMSQILLWGNAYNYIERRNGQIVALWPLSPARIQVDRAAVGDRGIIYRYTSDDDPIEIPSIIRSQEMLHIPGLSMNGRVGMSVIGANREAIALTMATAQFGTAFFGSGSRPGGVLMHERTLSPEAKRKLKTDWEAMHQGPANQQRVAVLDGNLKWAPISIPPEDAQFLETRHFQVAEVARIFRTPLVLLQEETKSTSWGTGVEQLMIAYVVYSLRPFMVRIEQEMMRKLLPPEERSLYLIEHMATALLRGDMKSRYESYKTGREWGWLSANDVNRMENLPPISDPSANEYLVPLNMAPARLLEEMSKSRNKTDATKTGVVADPVEPDSKKSLRVLLEPVVTRQLELLIERECRAVRKGMESRSIADFLPWLSEYYEKMPEFVAETVGAAANSAARSRGEPDPVTWAGEWCKRYANQSYWEIERAIRSSVDRDLDSKSVISLILDEWEAAKAARLVESIFAKEADHEG